MIVIEGPDLAGKTTLATALYQRIVKEERACHPVVRHLTRPEKHFDFYWGYRQMIQRDVIMDRMHMSHVVYRHVGDERHGLDPIRYRMVDAEIARVGGLVVVLAPQPDIVADRYDMLVAAGRREMYDRDYCVRVAAEYHRLACARVIETAVGVYRPAVDMAFTYCQPTIEIVEVVMAEWLLRQRVLDQIAEQRPGTI